MSTTYGWDNAWAEARRRLELLELAWDPGSHAALRAAGVGPGWRCLEIGGGGGSLVRWLCDAVGPAGSVVTTDLDTRFLKAIDAPNLEIIEGDMVTDGLPDGPFDLIHSRAVLMHIPARDALLPELVGRLRPGGTIVLEEPDFHSFQGAASVEYRDFMERFTQVSQAATGLDPEWGRTLPARLSRLGLTDLRCTAITNVFAGGSEEAQFFQLTITQTREVLLANGMAEAEFNKHLASLDDASQWFPGPAMITVTGHRPE